MKYFSIIFVGASALFFIPQSNAISQQNKDLRQLEFNQIVKTRLSRLNQKIICLKNSKNFNEYKNCQRKITKLQNIEFDKYVEKKLKKIDKLAKCIEESSNIKKLKSCKNRIGNKS